MKKILSLIIITLAFIGCEQFEDSYDRIEDTELRLLDFMYERASGANANVNGKTSADIAPGDTMLLTAVFSGKPANLDAQISDWFISFNVMVDLFGAATVIDSVKIKDIPGVKYYPYDFSENTRAVRFEIPVPKDIMKTSKAIPDGVSNEGIPEWWMLFATDPDNLETLIKKYPQIALMPKAQIIDALASYAPGGILDNEFLPILLQYFTVPFRVWANVRQEAGRVPHTIRSGHSVRYNGGINRVAPGRVPENNNPKIKHIAAYKIKGEIVNRSEWAGECDTILPVGGKLMIPIEDGYSYFVKAVSYDIDGDNDMSITTFGNPIRETHDASWQYRLDDAELRGVKYANYMDIYYTTGHLTPPKDKRIKKFVFWATVTDDVPNERLRPQGGTLAEVEGCFLYDGNHDVDCQK